MTYKNIRRRFKFATVIAVIGCYGAAASDSGHDADLAAISAFKAGYLKAINSGDSAALAALTDEDHVMLAPGRPPVVGKSANDAANSNAFRQFNIVEHWIPVETVNDGNLAYQRGAFTVDATPKAGGATHATRGSFLRIYRRRADGSWRMTRDMFGTKP